MVQLGLGAYRTDDTFRQFVDDYLVRTYSTVKSQFRQKVSYINIPTPRRMSYRYDIFPAI